MRRIRRLYAALMVFLPMPVWILVALARFPWIQPADSSLSLVQAAEAASMSALILFFVSLVGTGVVLANIEHRRARWTAAGVLLALHALAAASLYSDTRNSAGFAIFCLMFQALGIAGILIGTRAADSKRQSFSQ
jgi:hypothetical protein